MAKNLALFVFLLIPSSLYSFWPIYYEFGGEKRIFGPLISYEKEERTHELIIRPLLLIYEGDGVFNFPYPLGKFSKEKSYIFPIFLATSDVKRKTYLIGNFFYGKDKEESYAAFFPFFGEIKNRFGKERIGFFFWPLYGVSETKGKKKENFLWPIFSLMSGEEKGYKVFPFYGRREEEGKKKSIFFLWPIFFLEKKDMDTDDPYTFFFLLPFYFSGKRESKSFESYSIMFPFYFYSKTPERVKKSFFWPLVTKSEGSEKGLEIFPLFRRVVTEDEEKEGIIWPFFYTKSIQKKGEEFGFRFLILSAYEKKRDDLSFNVWPFFGYERKNGRSNFYAPFFFPFGFERIKKIINPLFSLVEYKKQDNWEGVSLFYGLYTQEKAGENWKRRLAFLAELKKEEGKYGFKFFFGLFGIEGSKLTFLFLPFNINQRDIQTEP